MEKIKPFNSVKYLEWNNIIAKFFFNPENAGKDIHLYITKEEILHIAHNYFKNVSDEEIWQDFISAIEQGLPGSIGNLTVKARYCYEKRALLRIDSIEVKYPPYITYLSFLVMPLIEEVDGDFRTNNYFDRLNTFLAKNSIRQQIWTEDFRDSNINDLWVELSSWATVKNNSDLGAFTVKPFTNKRWVYVGKLFSQCVFPPKAIKRLPDFFLAAGMIPDSTYQEVEIKRYLLQYGTSILMLPANVIDIIRNSETNELGQSIIGTVRKEYQEWNGEAHSIDDTGTTSRTKRNDISSRIYLQMQIFSNEGRIEFSYRMKSALEFPEDLVFNDLEIREEKLGYSRTLNLPFRETFQLKDDFNKWVAKFPEKDIRLFISGGLFQFSTDYWLETDILSKTNWMYLLCKNSLRERIVDWGHNNCTRFEDETELENVPSGYSLFKFLDPSEGIEGIPILTIIKEKNILLTSGLKIDFRTFTNDFLPEVEIFNSDGTEKVYLQYKDNEEKIFLKKKNFINNRWTLPDDISLYSDFNIRVDNEVLYGNETTYRVISSNGSAILLDNLKLPKRDSFGRIADTTLPTYSLGSNVIGANLLRQLPYEPLYKSRIEDSNPEITKPVYSHGAGNILVSFLALRKATTAQDFYAAFELLYAKTFGNKNQSDNFNFSKVKKASLNFLDYLGYLDYEYETKSIVVNPPQLIFVPVNKGRKVLLIGGRDFSLVNAIIDTAPKYNLQVEITQQFSQNEDLMLPDSITIKSFGSSRENFGVNNLIAFSEQLKINFNPSELVQVGLQQFCCTIEEYESGLFMNNETTLTYEDWARYIFNPDNLKMEKSFSEDFDKTFSLLEYRLRPWEFHYRLWVNQKCYEIDRNWGKFIALKYYQKAIILYDRMKEKVAVPIELPLPRLLAESIMLLSGLAPVYSEINGKAYRIYENIPSTFIQNLFSRLNQRTIDHKF